ncbi:MAG: glycosyltransferase family 2 protein [Pseudomonadota bacterium]
MDSSSPAITTQGAASVDPATVLVAIPTLNEERHIRGTLNAVIGDGSAPFKVVVADGGSADKTREIVTEMAKSSAQIHLIENPDRLQAAAINRVVENAAEPHHQVLVRVDAHSEYPAGYVMAVAQSLRAHGAQGLATVMDSVGDTCFQRGAAWAMETKLGSGGSGHRGGTLSGWVDHGHHAGFDLDTFRQVGGYDTSFVANEDAELDHRIGQAGGRIWLDATIRLDYAMRRSLKALAIQYWRYGIGRAQNLLKHRMRPRLRQLIPPVIFLCNMIAFLLAPFLPAALLVPLGYLALLAVMTLKTLKDKRSLCALWVGPALFVMHMVWSAGFLLQMIKGSPR